MTENDLIKTAKNYLRNPPPSVKIEGRELDKLKRDILDYLQRKASLTKDEQLAMAGGIKIGLIQLGKRIVKEQDRGINIVDRQDCETTSGTNSRTNTADTIRQRLVKCPECHTAVSSKAQSCPKCGNTELPTICSECSSVIPFEKTDCPSCGNPLEELKPASPVSISSSVACAKEVSPKKRMSCLLAGIISLVLLFSCSFSGAIIDVIIGTHLFPKVFCGILVLGTAIWAAIDAYQIEMDKYKLPITGHPVLIFFEVLLVWIIFFPAYLYSRSAVVAGTAPLKRSIEKSE